MARDPNLDTTARRRALAQLRQTAPPVCHLCGHRIDMTLDRRRHPLAWTGDDLTPRVYGGIAWDITNLRPAHRCCNSVRGERPITPHVRAQCLAAYRKHAGATPRGTRAW